MFSLSASLHTLSYIPPFLVALGVLIFVHEFGHYWVAKKCGVKIDSFSIGFGLELFGWSDRSGTRWKVSLLPLGGYVKMFGDADESSQPDAQANAAMSEEDRQHAFAHKPLLSRTAIVAAGPVFNFAFTLIVFALLFAIVGERFTAPDIGEVKAGSPAEAAGLISGDVIESINEQPMNRFEDIQQTVQLHPDETLRIHFRRGDEQHDVLAKPAITEDTDRFGTVQKTARLGIAHAGTDIRKLSPGLAVVESFRETGNLVSTTLTALWQIVKGTRSSDQVGGMLSIAKLSGDFAHSGFVDFVYFLALLSVNLGLINLFPIPVLDGGHLLFYAIEAVQGKPLGELATKYSFRFGLALVLTLAVFANWNDLVHLGVVSFVRDHLS
jgi:regulator of sigma E protease